MMGSVCGVCMAGLHQFVGRANDRGFVTCLPADSFDSGSHGGTGDVPEVPRYQVVDSVRDGDGIVCSIFRGFARNRLQVEQSLREFCGTLRRLKERDRLELFQAGAGGICVSSAGFIDNQF